MQGKFRQKSSYLQIKTTVRKLFTTSNGSLSKAVRENSISTLCSLGGCCVMLIWGKLQAEILSSGDAEGML